MQLSEELVSLNCEMMIHLQVASQKKPKSKFSHLIFAFSLLKKVIEDKSNYFRTCSPPSTWSPAATCQCLQGMKEPNCNARRSAQPYSSSYGR